jgi:hypothetical protein
LIYPQRNRLERFPLLTAFDSTSDRPRQSASLKTGGLGSTQIELPGDRVLADKLQPFDRSSFKQVRHSAGGFRPEPLHCTHSMFIRRQLNGLAGADSLAVEVLT